MGKGFHGRRRVRLTVIAWVGLAASAAAQGPAPLPSWLGPAPDLESHTGASEAQDRARDLSDRLRSPVYRERLEAESARLQREVFGQVVEAFPEASTPGGSPSLGLPPTDRVYLFISESIPLETLRNYAQDIADLGDPRIVMVLRGFVGGMKHVLPTRRFVLDVLRKDLDCRPDAQRDCELYSVNLVIDPRLFRRYGVQEVPTIVYATGDQAGDFRGGGERRGDAGSGRFWCIHGDSSLDSIFRRINKDAKSETLSALLNRGKGGASTR